MSFLSTLPSISFKKLDLNLLAFSSISRLHPWDLSEYSIEMLGDVGRNYLLSILPDTSYFK